MRKILITSTEWPTSAEVLAEATSLGAGEVVHRPLPRDLAELEDGYHEISDASDEPI